MNGKHVFSLSQEGLFNLLDDIEGRLHGEQTCVYEDASIDGRKLQRIIRYTLPVLPQTLQSYRCIKCCVYLFNGHGAVCADEENILSFC